MTLQPGQMLNSRYRVVRLLGQGGFGAVYRAWDTNLNRPCAVKENMDTSPEAQRQFTREATVLANLSHPNLPRVTDHFILAGQGQYLVMDYVEGEDLATAIRRDGPMPVEQALNRILQVADALHYLHGRQPPVVHRDVKPANIRITPDGKAMLVDFGLVKLYDPHLHTTLGARAVTPGYAPPEQYGQGSTDARTDQYALAATLYNLVTGQEPMESVQRMAGGQLPLAHQANPQTPLPTSLAIDRAMRLEPSQRFNSVMEFKNALAASTTPGVVARQGGEVVARPLRIPATQVVPSTPAFQVGPVYETAGPAVAPAPAGSAAPAAGAPVYPAYRPERKSGGGRGIGIVAGIAVVACLGLFALIGLYMIGQQSFAQQTADAETRATLSERVRTTSTAQSAALHTADAITQATAQAQATSAAALAYVSGLEKQATLVYGPSSGSISHDPANNLIEDFDAQVDLRNFILQARFTNPYGLEVADWDYGFILRHEAKNAQYRFVVLSDRTWTLLNNSGDADGVVVAQGEVPDLDTSAGGTNLLRLVFQNERGLFFLNDRLVSEFDGSPRTNAGGIFIVTGVYQGDEAVGYATAFSDFTIWSIP